MPLITWPSAKPDNNFSLSSEFTSCRTAFLDSTTLSFALSSLITLNSSYPPTKCSKSFVGETSASDPGKKAFMPWTSTVIPPLTEPVINPFKIASSSKQSSILFQTSCFIAFSLESLVLPCPSSIASRVNWTSSPISRSSSPDWLRNSLFWIAASDFKPTWTTRWFSKISITIPVTRLPCFIIKVLKFSSNNCSKLADIFLFFKETKRLTFYFFYYSYRVYITCIYYYRVFCRFQGWVFSLCILFVSVF